MPLFCLNANNDFAHLTQECPMHTAGSKVNQLEAKWNGISARRSHTKLKPSSLQLQHSAEFIINHIASLLAGNLSDFALSMIGKHSW